MQILMFSSSSSCLLVNCEILRKNLIPILPRLLWELIRKFSSGAGIYSQIAATSEDESTIKKYFNVCSKHKTQCQLCKRPIIPLSWSGKGFQINVNIFNRRHYVGLHVVKIRPGVVLNQASFAFSLSACLAS